MKLAIMAAFGAIVASGGAPGNAERAPCDPARKLRVLFVGNSFTYVQNVPALVKEVAASLSGPCIETAMIASGGATLEDHWRSDSVAARIRGGKWTHVVLNDQSSFGEGWWLEGRPRVGTSGRELARFGGRFGRLIREAGAIPVFLAHWADEDAPARDQQALDHLVAAVARQTGGVAAPVGQSIKRMQSELPAIPPYFTDHHHLSPAGAYLEALVIYSTLTGRSPIGAAPRIDGLAVEFNRGIVSDSVVTLVDLAAPDATAIQRIAEATSRTAGERNPAGSAPKPLSAEFPPVPTGGDVVRRRALVGHWRGGSRVLPNPAGDSVRIDLSVEDGSEPSRPATVELRAGELQFDGPATVSLEGKQIVVHASVLPQPARRSPTEPLVVELRAVLRGNLLIGVATIRQRFAGTMSSFDAIGRFEARRVAPEIRRSRADSTARSSPSR
jgi:hypothetical protein